MAALVDRNHKWRLNDMVFYEKCELCEIKIEWQAENPQDNTANNFRIYLTRTAGWKKQRHGLFGPMVWVCNNH